MRFKFLKMLTLTLSLSKGEGGRRYFFSSLLVSRIRNSMYRISGLKRQG